MATKRASKRSAPWKRENPKSHSRKMSPSQKRSAKARAKKAGRPYPNLVDNMNAARRKKKPARRASRVK